MTFRNPSVITAYEEDLLPQMFSNFAVIYSPSVEYHLQRGQCPFTDNIQTLHPDRAIFYRRIDVVLAKAASMWLQHICIIYVLNMYYIFSFPSTHVVSFSDH